MPIFASDIETDYPIDIIQENLGDACLEFRVGYLPDLEEIVLQSVTLAMMNSNSRSYDLRFGFRTKSMIYRWRVSGMDFTQPAVDYFVPRRARPLVLDLVLNAIEALVTAEAPEFLTTSTYDQCLPTKALVKYDRIEERLHRIGYITEDHFIVNGRDRWEFITHAL